MGDEDKLAQILFEEGFEVSPGLTSIPEEIPGKTISRYRGLNILLSSHLANNPEELLIKLNKVEGSKEYICEYYQKKH